MDRNGADGTGVAHGSHPHAAPVHACCGGSHADEAARLDIAGRLTSARTALRQIETPAHLEKLRGGLGAEPIETYL